MKNAEIINIDLKELNGQTITLGQLIDGINAITNKSNINTDIELESKIFVPMYQRNYKWDQETAVKLVKDLIFASENKKDKSISLFTLYVDKHNNIQVVDGQQRMITLLLLYKAIEKEEYFINLEFERDYELNNETRKEFIDNINSQFPSNFNIALSDKRRLYYNYLGILTELNDCRVPNIDSFIEYLRERVKLLLHITEDEPVSEFLNLNCNKTKFSVCDRVRSALITYTTFNSVNDENKELIAAAIECTDFKKGISILFEELTRLLYCEDIYSTVNLGYINPDKSKENRINIMFSKLVNNPNTGYMDCKSLERVDKVELMVKLFFYKTVLKELETDFRNRYYVTSNAFKNFYHHKKVLFFDLVDKYFDYHFDNEKTKLSQILHTEHSIDNLIMDYIRSEESGDDVYFVNSYFQVLSSNEPNNDKTKYETLLKSEYRQQNIDKSKYFPLGKKSFEDVVQGSGKYILYRYIDQHQKENDNNIKFTSIVTLEENKKIECEEMEQKDKILSKINIKDFLCTDNRKIIIPVIQRDYCMGSHFDQIDKVDMLDYIIKNFNDGRKEVTLSAITVFQPNKNDIYIYDGQQRLFTLASLIKLLDEKSNSTEFCELLFEHRENFNKFTKTFFNGTEKESEIDSYAKKSVANLKKALEKKLKGENLSKNDLKDYVLNSISLDVITVDGALSSAEQFFVEINDGVQLEPYEIFKCKINAKYQDLVRDRHDDNTDRYKSWISFIDNHWLDFFYRFNETKLEDEIAKEELMEMRFIEFCCRMIYWEKYLNKENGKHPSEIKSFEKAGNEMGDMDIFIEALTISDFERIIAIVNGLVQFQKNSNAVSCIEEDCGNDTMTGFSHYNPDKYDKDYLIEKFLGSLKDDKLDYHDVIIWGVLNGYNESIIKDSMNYWNNKKINKNNFAVLYPGFIGVWHHICLPIPKYYTDKSYQLIEKALDMELIDDIENEYNDVMKHLCLKSNHGISSVQWGYNSSRYAKKWSDLVNIAASDVFYYRTGSPNPEKVENKKVVLCSNSSNYVVLANADNKNIYCALTTRYENSSRFMKGIGEVIEIETSTPVYQVTIQTRTKNNTYTETIKIQK